MGWFMNVPSSNYRSFSGLWLRDLSRCEVVQTNRDGSIIVGVLNGISQSPDDKEVHVPQWLIALIFGKNCIPIPTCPASESACFCRDWRIHGTQKPPPAC